jgi:hypothetical protein
MIDSLDTAVDTSNYFAVAAADDRENISASASGSSGPAPAPDDKAAKKARRIVEAVERSKKEYTAENVYTERRVCPASI